MIYDVDILRAKAESQAEDVLHFLKEAAIRNPEDFIQPQLAREIKSDEELRVCVDAAMHFYPEDYNKLAREILSVAKELMEVRPISPYKAINYAIYTEEVEDTGYEIVKSKLLEAIKYCKSL